MLDFTFYAPTKFVFGRGAENQAGAMLRDLGAKKTLIHYGGGSAVRSGLIDRVKASVEAEGIEVYTLGGAQPNPRSSLVRKGIELVRKEGIDSLLAVGGGSVIDSCKAMAVGVPYDGDFWDFYCGKAKPVTKIPLGVVLTMAAAGSEGSNSCVISNDEGERMIKRGLGTELNRPQFALENPAWGGRWTSPATSWSMSFRPDTTWPTARAWRWCSRRGCGMCSPGIPSGSPSWPCGCGAARWTSSTPSAPLWRAYAATRASSGPWACP